MKKTFKKLTLSFIIVSSLLTTLNLGNIDHSTIYYVKEVPDEFN